MHKYLVVLLWTIALAGILGGVVTAAPLRPPSTVRHQLLNSDLAEIVDVRKLPTALRTGNFTVAGFRVGNDWRLANPHTEWQETDVVMTPGLPRRRLIFAACDPTLCILHYELGGIGYSTDLLALERAGNSYRTLWHVIGYQVVPNLKALRRLIRSGADTRFFTAKDNYGY